MGPLPATGRRAGFSAGDDKDFRSVGAKKEASPKVRALMALAKAEGGSDPDVGDAEELKKILWKHARSANQQASLRAGELLSRLKGAEAGSPDDDPPDFQKTIKGVRRVSPFLAYVMAYTIGQPFEMDAPEAHALLFQADRMRERLAAEKARAPARNGHAPTQAIAATTGAAA
jgi:hypothetical protein